MKLYYAKGACSLAVRIIINELKINCDFEAVNLKTKQTENGSDYLQINPKGAVPALQLDDQQILTENVVIQQYLADKYNAAQLLPAINNIARYRILEWLNFISTELHKTCAPLFNPAYPQEIKDTIIIPNFKNKINVVDKQLFSREYLAGSDFTLADSYLFVIITWLPRFGLSLDAWPNIKRYFNRMQNRASVAQALNAEGISLG